MHSDRVLNDARPTFDVDFSKLFLEQHARVDGFKQLNNIVWHQRSLMPLVQFQTYFALFVWNNTVLIWLNTITTKDAIKRKVIAPYSASVSSAVFDLQGVGVEPPTSSCRPPTSG